MSNISKYFAVLFILFLMLPLLSEAQKLNVFKGKLSVLKGEKELNIQYDYSDMTVGKYSEKKYVDKKIKEKNKDEAGEGDVWHEKWIADRSERFEPKFEELINKGLDGKIKAGSDEDFADAKYTLIVKTTHTEPGWNVGVSRKPAHINMEYWVVETANKETVKAKARMEKIPGQGAMGYDFDAGFRLQESYAKAGKSLAKYLNKKVLK